ncbi:hypothetical protein NMY22_g11249 [Coprinellus aureogranulatus]|nr:hypothetical protein NMY22_g11249 [Coprinellus aureogranulatus]
MRCAPRPSLPASHPSPSSTRPRFKARSRRMEPQPRTSGVTARTSYEPTLVESRTRKGGDVERGAPMAVEAEPFRIGTWLKLHGVDIFTLAIIGMLCLIVHTRDPAPNRVFPIYNLDGSLAYPDLAYPRNQQIIPIWASAIMAIFIPTLFFALFQIRRKSMDDFLTSFMGILKSVVTAAFLQVVIKALIGGLRPHFYSVCEPDLDIAHQALAQASSTNLIPMFDRSICRGNKQHIDDALESMPSGHSAAAWAGLFFLALYFNAQLKVISAHNPAYWKMIIFFMPILGACLLSGYLVTDGHHHFSDILAGGLIGIFTALVAFRQTFASITDFRFNHVLLPRATSLLHRKTPFTPVTGRGPFYPYDAEPAFLPRDLPVAREGGWTYGAKEQVGGAPGDATVLAMSGVGSHGLRR